MANRRAVTTYDLDFDISLPQADISDATPMHHGPALFDLLRSPRPELGFNKDPCRRAEEFDIWLRHVSGQPGRISIGGPEVELEIIFTDVELGVMACEFGT